MSDFKTTIGLEIHAQLKTDSKMFCGCGNNAEGAEPNTLVCPVCLGLPGVLPVANARAIEWTLKTGLALNCEIPESAKFDRKHYFYPDLPKGYQISQYDQPFCIGGYIELRNASGEVQKINLTRIHLEEDAGKLIHPSRDRAEAGNGDYSLVDLNRAGTPLMEIVTEPEISSPAEAKIFMQELRAILRTLDVSDADMEKGHLRCDANISVSESDKLGTPVEIKNMNSFRMIERALLFEEKRQREALANGEKIVKETRGWDDAKGLTYSQRSKEQAQDYRYFPEPDLPPFKLEKFNLDQLKKELPELPAEKRKKYQEMGLRFEDAALISIDKELSSYFEKVASKIDPKISANWIINELKMDGILIIRPENLIELLEKLQKGEIIGKMAKDILVEMIKTGQTAAIIIKEKGLEVVGDKASIEKIVEEVLRENEKTVADYRNGKNEAMGYLIGQVMQKSRGSANPQIVNDIIKERLK